MATVLEDRGGGQTVYTEKGQVDLVLEIRWGYEIVSIVTVQLQKTAEG